MIKFKKPPDKIVVVKCPLKLILKDDKYKPFLFDACYKTNQIVIHTYQFLRLFILQKYNNKIEIPPITKDTIKMVFKSLIKEGRGPKSKGNNSKLLDEFNKFYEEQYKNLGLNDKLDGSYLSQILDNQSTDMLTNIENNIKLHFFKYVNRFVNSCFKKINNNLVEKAENGKKTELRKELSKDVYEIKQDLLNNTLKSNKKYHKWIETHRNNIFPKEFKNSYEFDIQNEPQKYIKSMIYMCEQIEKEGTKLFQFFPLRTDITLKNIQLDTKSLIEIFIREDKNSYLKNIESCKEKIWKMIFKLDNHIFKQSNYVFDYVISTDCYSVSIKMLNKNNIEEENKKKTNKKNKKSQNAKLTKEMTQEQKEQFKKNEETKKKTKETEFKLKLKEKKDKEKEDFKKLPKEEQKKLREKQKEENKKKKLESGEECQYIDDLNDKQLKELDNNNFTTIDIGIKNIFFMKNKKGVRFRYTNRKHAFRIRRFKYQKIIKKHKDANNITPIENELSNYNSKSVNFNKFKDFILNKNRVNGLLFEKYNNEKFRKYKWYGFLNRKKADAKLIRELKKIFGKDSIMILGDASISNGVCKKGNISTPNTKLNKLIKENFKTYYIDEFRTSKLHYKTEEPCDNLYHIDNNNDKTKRKERKIHSVLTFKMEKKQSGCINRDENAVNNMLKIVNHQIKYKERPLRYRRDYDLTKGSNPTKKIIKSTKKSKLNMGQVEQLALK
jgi:hypothetical protein